MKIEFKDQCDNCLKYKKLIGYKNKCLCLDCILKILLEKGEIDMEGLEKIKILSSEINDEPLLKIIRYLLTREDMNEKYLNEEKNLKQMVEYINRKAEEKRHHNAKIIIVDDEEVFGWAIHYFDESNKNLNIKENSEEETKKEKKIEVKNPQKKEWIAEGQLSLFDNVY